MQPQDIQQELERARDSGPTKTLVIPPCPELLSQLQRVMEAEDPDLNAVARIAGSDVAMSAALLKLVNSPLYARSRRVETIDQAMSTLGLRQTAAMLTGFLVRSSLPVNSPLLGQFWERSGRRALALGHIARQLYNLEPDLAHTMGLFSHVGIPVMLQGLRGYSSTLVEAQARIDRSFIATENAAHRTDHAVVGALVARTWRLAPSIQMAVRLHHDFNIFGDEQLPMEVRSLVAANLVADHMVHRYDTLESEADWLAHGPVCMDFLGVTEMEVTDWMDTLHEAFAAPTS
nr:HDOD domain-containing protein [uncultured Roseateles sp.]